MAATAVQVTHELITMQNDLFSLILEAEPTFRVTYLQFLENMSLYGRLNELVSTLDWVNNKLDDLTQMLCSFSNFEPGETYSYD